MRYESTGKRQPNIVVIGGGTGLPIILKSLNDCGADVTGIVTVADDGGSSGKIRESFNAVPPGDIRNALVALSTMPEDYKNLFQYRFRSDKDKELDGHPIGNLMIQAASEMQGNFYNAVQMLAEMLEIEGKVYPSCENPLVLNARYTDGTVLSGESKIPKQRKQIDYVTVSLVKELKDQGIELKAGRNVVESIMNADMIVLGPGSLYTSILPNLMIPDLGEAVLKTPAKVAYICNIMTQYGETEEFSDANHVEVLHKHLNEKFVDIAIVNNEQVSEDYDASANEEDLLQVEHSFKELRKEVDHVISSDFLLVNEHGVYHNGDKVAREIYKQARNQMMNSVTL